MHQDRFGSWAKASGIPPHTGIPRPSGFRWKAHVAALSMSSGNATRLPGAAWVVHRRVLVAELRVPPPRCWNEFGVDVNRSRWAVALRPANPAVPGKCHPGRIRVRHGTNLAERRDFPWIRSMFGHDQSMAVCCLDPSARRKVQVLNAWPLLLDLDQVSAYVGLSPVTFRKICPVPAIALGVAVTRWNRNQIDEWVNSLPPKNSAVRRAEPVPARPYDVAKEAAEARRSTAVQKIRERQNARFDR